MKLKVNFEKYLLKTDSTRNEQYSNLEFYIDNHILCALGISVNNYLQCLVSYVAKVNSSHVVTINTR